MAAVVKDVWCVGSVGSSESVKQRAAEREREAADGSAQSAQGSGRGALGRVLARVRMHRAEAGTLLPHASFVFARRHCAANLRGSCSHITRWGLWLS